MRKLQSIAMLLMAFCLSLNFTSCSSDDDDNKTNSISKEDLIGFWEVDKTTSEILTAKVNGEDISVEKLKEDHGDYSPTGLLFLNEDGTASFNDEESSWKVNGNGFNLFATESEGTNYKVTNLSYDKMTIDYEKTIKDSEDEITITCHASLKRYSLESTSKDNSLIVGHWKAVVEDSYQGVVYRTEYDYEFYSNGSYKFKLALVGMFENTQFGLYSFDKTKNILKTNNVEIPAVLDGNKLIITSEGVDIEFIKQ